MNGIHSMMKTGFLLIAFVALAGCTQVEPTEPTTTTVIVPARPAPVVERTTVVVPASPAPAKVVRVVERKTVIIHDKPAPATHTTVVVPGPPGPPGPAGAPGAPGAPAPTPTPEGGPPDGGGGDK